MTETSKEDAAALFMLAEETGLAEEFSRSLDIMEDAFVQNPELVEYLAAPTIPKQERTQALQEIFGDLVQEHLLSFAQLLCEKGHIRSFVTCAREFREMLQRRQNIASARVVSAVELTEAEQLEIKKKLEAASGHSVLLECRLDPSLMAGLVIYMDGKVMDGSLRHRLRELKEVMDE